MSRWAGPGERLQLEVTLNGEPATLTATPRTTLADAVRAQGLTGTHLGCEHGICGACTLLLDGEPARGCLVLAVQAAGRRIDTVEGLARDGELNAVQRAFVEHRAQQCGFCTPGFVVLASWLAEREPDADEPRVREVLASNLCRCTGYAPIIAAALAARGAA
jgi:aerobic-type carbon monoxide dehydrogenase small subunit (CoxS/CutS family)